MKDANAQNRVVLGVPTKPGGYWPVGLVLGDGAGNQRAEFRVDADGTAALVRKNEDGKVVWQAPKE
jgi:hypothetical protein